MAKPALETVSNPPAHRVGLALGSGSARGLAHIGVLRAIEEAGIEIDVIAGTSMGALIGAIFVAGKLDGLAARFLDFDWKGIVSLRWRAESRVQAEGACPMWRNTPFPESGFRVDNEKNKRRSNKHG